MPGPNVSESYNLDFLEQQYLVFQRNPEGVSRDLQLLFHGAEFFGNGKPSLGSSNGVQESAKPLPFTTLNVETRLQSAAIRLINTYRLSGHLLADSNPLQLPSEVPPELDYYRRHELEESDLDKTVDASMLFGSNGPMTLRAMIAHLKEAYCGSVGFEYMHVQRFEARHWLATQIEPMRFRDELPPERRQRILASLRRAEAFENFLQLRFLGKKRFGLEGGDTLMPMLDAIAERSAQLGVQEIVLGMAHRGRLNVLTNFLKLPYEDLFERFHDPYHPDAVENDGDVKYHLGRSDDIVTANGNKVHLTLSANPSHLEAVNPVVQGRVRCKQRLHGDLDRKAGMPLLIHGDAAFAGQGIVMETLCMANLMGYRTGGTIHIIINNQIGFTTHPRDARSTQYCTDLAKFVHAPIFHVNVEDPDACVRIAELAAEYRQKYSSDVVIDLICYRKMGHNENDDATMTQPAEYRKIAEKYATGRTAVPIYTKRLIADGTTTEEAVAAQDAAYRDDILEKAFKASKEKSDRTKLNGEKIRPIMPPFSGRWKGLTNDYSHDPVDTVVRGEVLDRIADALVAVPAGFQLHKNLGDKVFDAGKQEWRYPSNDSPFRRRELIKARGEIDWGTAEAMAFGSLLLEKHPVRLSGQDSRRATFSFRHSYYYTATDTGSESFCPLANLGPDAAPFDVFDSFLSEAAVLGFEYGYSLDDPNALVLWEAQFGDFVNGAQVIIDQFIASGESKWNRSSGLVMLLPHGYEGQGPEHSSARPERFLQLCAEENIQVCTFTTPAQYFHALRRQVKRNFRKPMIVMTPKSYLRTSTSPVEELMAGRFREVLDDATVADPAAIRRLLLCTGKVYFDLATARKAAGRTDVAIVRIEQLYPWPEAQLRTVLDRYPQAERVWVQEESENNGSWFFVEPRLRKMKAAAEYCGRDASASPAVGSEKMHKHEQDELVHAALNLAVPYSVE